MFDIISRYSLEESGDRMNQVVLAEITQIEKKIKERRQAGNSPGVIEKELKPVVDELVMRLQQGYQNNISSIDQAVEDYKTEYLKKQDLNPSKELLRLKREELEVNTMSDAEIENEAMNYDANTKDMSLTKSKLMLQRLPDSQRDNPNADSVRDLFKKNITATRLDRPWINTLDRNALLDDKQRFLDAGSGLIVDGMKMPVESLIDYSGGMEAD